MSMPYRAPRPASVTTVVVLTWVVAIFAVLGGVAMLVIDEATLADLSLDSSAVTAYGWGEIIFGAVAALVAIGLGNGNRFSRFLVTVLMVMRLIAAGFVAVLLQGTTGFWSALVAAGIAVVILGMLWNARASTFFLTN